MGLNKIMEKTVRGNLEEIILTMLKKQNLHGYAVIAQIRKKYGVYFGPSTIYPLLGSFESEGKIKSAWDMNGARPRKVYTLTDNGLQAINEYAFNLKVIVHDCIEMTV